MTGVCVHIVLHVTVSLVVEYKVCGIRCSKISFDSLFFSFSGQDYSNQDIDGGLKWTWLNVVWWAACNMVLCLTPLYMHQSHIGLCNGSLIGHHD